jgi:alpha-tubulin suppressor-like RCC1 family protein
VQGGRVFKTLSAGSFHTCATTSDGALYCWGDNGSGQLAQPDSVEQSAMPIQVSLISVAAVAAGPFHTCALLNDRRTFCWGSNVRGALGRGDTLSTLQFTPAEISGTHRFVALTTGLGVAQGSTTRSVTCGRTVEAVAYCWGTGEDGQTGTGTTASVGVPTPVAGGLRFSSLGAGLGFACGLTADGTAYCWGSNRGGRLGREDVLRSLVPVPILAAEGQ